MIHTVEFKKANSLNFSMAIE